MASSNQNNAHGAFVNLVYTLQDMLEIPFEDAQKIASRLAEFVSAELQLRDNLIKTAATKSLMLGRSDGKRDVNERLVPRQASMPDHKHFLKGRQASIIATCVATGNWAPIRRIRWASAYVSVNADGMFAVPCDNAERPCADPETEWEPFSFSSWAVVRTSNPNIEEWCDGGENGLGWPDHKHACE